MYTRLALSALGLLGWMGATVAQDMKAANSAGQLADRSLYRRAVEAAIWGMPAVNYERMLQAAAANGA